MAGKGEEHFMQILGDHCGCQACQMVLAHHGKGHSYSMLNISNSVMGILDEGRCESCLIRVRLSENRADGSFQHLRGF